MSLVTLIRTVKTNSWCFIVVVFSISRSVPLFVIQEAKRNLNPVITMPRKGPITRFQFSSHCEVEGYCLDWNQHLINVHDQYQTSIRTLKKHLQELRTGNLQIQLTDFIGIFFLRYDLYDYNCAQIVLVYLKHFSIIIF